MKMSKKKDAIKSGMNLLFSDQDDDKSTDLVPERLEDKPSRGRPKSNFRHVTKTSQIGTRENETRATFIVNERQLEEIKALAHWERITIKEALTEAFNLYLSQKKNELDSAIKAYSDYQNRYGDKRKADSV
jgi:hypothetical protein